MILEFADALINEARAVAVLSAWSKLQLPYEDLSKAGFQLTLDPFFRSLLLAVYRNAVAGLRYKTCIALPVDRGRNMLGVVDTTNKLRYGEAFVQSTEMRSPHVQHKGPPKKTVITSTVLVTKCPFLHPGDVRKIPAVDVPELHHVIECIVVPAHGPRPHPDKWPVPEEAPMPRPYASFADDDGIVAPDSVVLKKEQVAAVMAAASRLAQPDTGSGDSPPVFWA
ncbi:hypothetical protein MRX96_021197 [Rhipicephalus microplus]